MSYSLESNASGISLFLWTVIFQPKQNMFLGWNNLKASIGLCAYLCRWSHPSGRYLMQQRPIPSGRFDMSRSFHFHHERSLPCLGRIHKLMLNDDVFFQRRWGPHFPRGVKERGKSDLLPEKVLPLVGVGSCRHESHQTQAANHYAHHLQVGLISEGRGHGGMWNWIMHSF